jgi:hypothetical protein
MSPNTRSLRPKCLSTRAAQLTHYRYYRRPDEWRRSNVDDIIDREVHRAVGETHQTVVITGRDAVRLLAKGKETGGTHLAKALTRNPVTITPRGRVSCPKSGIITSTGHAIVQ